MTDNGAIAISFDLDGMTFGEMVDFEEFAGLAVTQLSEQTMTSRAILALVWINMRRDNPGFTLEDARAIRLDQVDFADPTPPEATGELKPLKKQSTPRAKVS